MRNPLISVVVPVYNVEKYLEQCLETLVYQTYKRLEIIIVDDASPDNSSKIYKKYASIDSRIRIINHQKNKGVSAARNSGLNAASGDYVHFFDSDDYINCEFYEKFALSMNMVPDTDILLGGLKSQHSGIFSFKFEDTTILKTMNEKFSKFYIMVTPFLFRKKFLDKNKLQFPVGQKIAEDTLFATEALVLANRLVTVPGTEYHYMRTYGSVINKDHDAQILTQQINAEKVICETFKKHNVTYIESSIETIHVYRLLGIPLLKVVEIDDKFALYLFGLIKIKRKAWQVESSYWVNLGWQHYSIIKKKEKLLRKVKNRH